MERFMQFLLKTSYDPVAFSRSNKLPEAHKETYCQKIHRYQLMFGNVKKNFHWHLIEYTISGLRQHSSRCLFPGNTEYLFRWLFSPCSVCPTTDLDLASNLKPVRATDQLICAFQRFQLPKINECLGYAHHGEYPKVCFVGLIFQKKCHFAGCRFIWFRILLYVVLHV